VKHLGKNTKVYVEEIVTRDIFGRRFDHDIEDPVGSWCLFFIVFGYIIKLKMLNTNLDTM